MIKIFYNRLVACPYSEKLCARAAHIASGFDKKIKGSVEVNIVSPGEIKKINKIYRHKNQVTDVLSFAWQEDQSIQTDWLGQIYICYTQIKRQARSYAVGEREEFLRMLVHGLLHLAGYDHQTPKTEKTMFVLQEKILKII